MKGPIALFVEYVIGALKDIQTSIDRSNELFEKRENRIMAAIDDLTAQVNRAIANGARAIADVSAELAAVKQALIDAAAGSPSQSALLEDLATRLGASADTLGNTADTLEAFTASLTPTPPPPPPPPPPAQPVD